MQNTLFLHEEILLLALRDEEGTIASGTMYQYAIGAAMLAELLLNRRIAVDESSKRKLVDLVSSTPLGEPLVDECLEKISSAKRRTVLQTWVSRFAGVKSLKHRVAQELCRRGILRADEDKVLLIFTRKIYPEVNPEPERKLIERLRRAIFTDTADANEILANDNMKIIGELGQIDVLGRLPFCLGMNELTKAFIPIGEKIISHLI